MGTEAVFPARNISDDRSRNLRTRRYALSATPLAARSWQPMRRILPALMVLVVVGQGAGQPAIDPAESEPPRLPAVAPVPPAKSALDSPEPALPIRFDATWD